MNKNIYDLKMFEVAIQTVDGSNTGVFVRRVPGGWTFTEYETNIDHEGNQTTSLSSVFVPWHNED